MRYLLVLVLALLAGCNTLPPCESWCKPVEGTPAHQHCLDLCDDLTNGVAVTDEER